MAELKFKELTEKIIGAAMVVHSTLGNGFPERIYQRAFALELGVVGLRFQGEYVMPVYYRGCHIGTRRVDFLIEGHIAVELKALFNLEPGHFAQAKNYLEACNLEIGLLINFGATSLQFKRVFNSKYNPNPANP